jgi:hypothetical protein
MNTADVYMYEYGTLKPVKVILRRRREKRENNGGGETKWAHCYAHIEMPQRSSLYNYYILIKRFQEDF